MKRGEPAAPSKGERSASPGAVTKYWISRHVQHSAWMRYRRQAAWGVCLALRARGRLVIGTFSRQRAQQPFVDWLDLLDDTTVPNDPPIPKIKLVRRLPACRSCPGCSV